MSKIIAAAEAGKLKTLQSLLDKTSPEHLATKLSRTDGEGFSAVHYASMNGHLDCVAALLKAGANASMRSKAGVEPHMLAAQNGHTKICELLLSVQGGGAKIDSVDNDAQSALLYAAQEADAATIDFLIGKEGANPNLKDHDGWACIHYAAQGGLDILKLLVKKYNVDLRSPTNEGSTALHVAAESGEFDICDWILDEGKDQLVPLLFPGSDQNDEKNAQKTVSVLLNEAVDVHGYHPLHSAVCADGDRLDLVKLFVEKYKADVFVKTTHLSAEQAREQYKKHVEMQHNINSGKQSHSHQPHLVVAADQNSSNGSANPAISQSELDKIKDIPPKTAYDIALEYGHKNIAKYLKSIIDAAAQKANLDEETERQQPKAEEPKKQEKKLSVVMIVEPEEVRDDESKKQQQDEKSSAVINYDTENINHQQSDHEEIYSKTQDTADLQPVTAVDVNRLHCRFNNIKNEDDKISKTECLLIMMNEFPEESVAEFTGTLNRILKNQHLVNFETCVEVAKKVVEGKNDVDDEL